MAGAASRRAKPRTSERKASILMRHTSTKVGMRTSSLALLSVSAALLLAAGETLHHVHAGAFAGEGATPTPGIALAAMMAAESAAIAESSASALAETTEEANAMTTPIFKPFVMVRVPLPSGYTHGEVMGLNESNQAVGWMHHVSENRDHAFFFDPAEGVTILDLNTQQHDAAWAYAISNDSTPIIAGAVMWKGVPNYLRACTWTGPTGSLTVPFGSGVVSTIYAVNDVSSTTTLAGMYEVSSESRSVVYDGAFEYPAPGVNGEARGMNAGGKVVGWHIVNGKSHAYSWVSDTTGDINPYGYDYSGAFSVNTAGNIGGWVAESSLSSKIPALWTLLFQGVYTVDPFPVGSSAAVTALNIHGEMAITREGGSGAAIWSKRTGVDDADLLDDLTLMRGGDDVLHSAWAINDNGWIGGSYLAGGTGDPQPCLIIPYDVDNNGTPDYRQILEGKREGFTDLDTNDNWLLDWGESINSVGMRVGLNGPGYGNPSHAIANTRVVSQSLHIGALPEDATDDDYAIEDVLLGEVGCEEFRTGIEHWARATQFDPQEREVSMLLRSTLSGATDQDYLPGNGNEFERTQLLASIHKFAYQFAWCIDYVQTGNEVFGGAGGYRFYYDSELFECDEWQGVRTFQELDADCKEEAVLLVRDWLEDQAWAALEGSALAGRPLRLVGPGIIYAHVLAAHAYQGGGGEGAAAFFIMDNIVDWLNANQMHFDMHLHYRSIAEGMDAIDDLIDAESNWGGPPNWKVSREFGPTATDEWASGSNLADFARFRDDYTTQGPCSSNCCNQVPADGNWDAFVLDNWRNAQFNNDFEMDTFLAALASEGWTWVAYGPVHMAAPHQVVFDMATLRANHVCDNRMHQNRSLSTRFTPLTDEFEVEAANFSLTFPQNRRTCPECE